MMQPGQKKSLAQPIRSQRAPSEGTLNWVDGAVQTMFGSQGASAGQTLFGASAEQKDQPNLATYAMDLLLIGIKIAEVSDIGPAEALQKLLLSYFKEFERSCALARKPSDQVEQAKYALTAFLDEAVINSHHACRQQWIEAPLQDKFFKDPNAGENFFVRLEEMLADLRGNIESVEVYYLCLALGFQGRYRLHNTEKLPVVVSNMLKKIDAVRGAAPKALSPSANVHPGKASKENTGRLLWILSFGFLALAIILYFVLMHFSAAPLDSVSDLLEKLNAGAH